MDTDVNNRIPALTEPILTEDIDSTKVIVLTIYVYINMDSMKKNKTR